MYGIKYFKIFLHELLTDRYLGETFSFSPKNFLDFRLDTIETIINLTTYSRKTNAYVVMCDSEVAFLEGCSLCPFLYCVLCIHSVASLKYVYTFSCFPYFRRYFIELSSCSVFNIFSIASSSSLVNCPSLLSSWQLIIFFVSLVGLSVISRKFPSRFLKCVFLLLKSFFLDGSFYFGSRDVDFINACHANRDCQSEFLILLMITWIYSSCSF